MISDLKNWTISLVLTSNNEFTSHAFWALWVIAFAESSFFPIPPDIPFIMMGIVQPHAAFFMAALMTSASVLGAILGYWIGYFGGRPLVEWIVGHRLLGKLFTREKFQTVEFYYQRYDIWAVLIAAFTPIPYKVFTIGGGLCQIRFWPFLLVSILGRAGRFFLVGAFLYFLGNKAQFILKRFDLFLVAMLVLGLAGFWAIKFFKPKESKKN